MLALAAKDNDIPRYAVVPTSTIDLSLKSGGEIPIEERDSSEVLELTLLGNPAAPKTATARNPAFDVTPHRLVTGIVTENGVAYPPFEESLPRMVRGERLEGDQDSSEK
jgi:methylthioribose-1-phosphate isomerase